MYQSQKERKLIQILGEMYNNNSNSLLVMLALSPVSSQSEQYKLILSLKILFLRSTFIVGRAHYGQLIYRLEVPLTERLKHMRANKGPKMRKLGEKTI